jgi:phage replication O-like protein O
MAKAQLENGFTRIANEIIDCLMQTNLSGREMRVFMSIIRETYGWNTKDRSVSLSRIAELIRIDRKHVPRLVRNLIDRNMIKRNGVTGIQSDTAKWTKVSPNLGAPNSGAPKMVSEVSPKMVSDVTPNSGTPLLLKTRKDNERQWTHPSVDQVRAYCQERKNGIDPQRFVDFYAAKDWMIGRNRMKDWQACVRTWEARDGKGTVPKNAFIEYQAKIEQQYRDGRISVDEKNKLLKGFKQ